jgi:8-oxo-dGTP diphosphatase
MGKSTRTPVLAAGGIVIRNGGKPLIAIVQRRRDNAWVLPKGKLKPNEKPIAAARREAMEETGADVRVHEFLGVISYLGGSGPKIAHFWRMQAIGGPAGKPMDDIKAVEWLPLAAAIERLNLPHEQIFLRNVGRKALNRTLKKTRRRPPTEEAILPAADIAPAVAAIQEKAPASAEPVTPAPTHAAVPRVKLVTPQPRWEVLTRLTRRWQAAVGRTRRIG